MQTQRNLLPARYRRPYRPRRQQGMVNEVPRDQAWPGTIMAFGVIVWLVAFWFLGSRTLIAYSALFRWFALFAFAGNLVPYRFSGLKLGMERGEWFFFNLLAIGPFLFAFALSFNLTIHGPEQQYVVPGGLKMDMHRYWIENGSFPPLIPIENQTALTAYNGKRLLGLSEGVLGYPVISTWSVIENE